MVSAAVTQALQGRGARHRGAEPPHPQGARALRRRAHAAPADDRARRVDGLRWRLRRLACRLTARRVAPSARGTPPARPPGCSRRRPPRPPPRGPCRPRLVDRPRRHRSARPRAPRRRRPRVTKREHRVPVLGPELVEQASGGSSPSVQVSPTRARPDNPRSSRSASTLPVTNRQRSSASAASTWSRAPTTTSRRVKSTIRSTWRYGVEHLAQGRDAHVARPRGAVTSERSSSPTEASRPHRRSSDWSCSTTIAPSRVRRRSSSSMSAPWATAAAKAGSVFSRWPDRVATVGDGDGTASGSRTTSHDDARRSPRTARLRIARVDRARHVGDDLVERRLNQVVHRRLGDVHAVGPRATIPSTTDG